MGFLPLAHPRLGTLSFRLILGLAALLTLAVPPASADHCPIGQHQGVYITSPADGAQNLAGTIHVDFTRPALPSGYSWTGANVLRVFTVNDSGVETVYDEVVATQIDPPNGTQFFANWNSNAAPNGRYRFYAISVFTPGGTGHDQCWSAGITFTIGNPSPTRMVSDSSLHCSCRCDQVSTGSSTSPLAGHQSFTLPVTSWTNRGASFGFSVTYGSHALRDPNGLETPEFARLSQRNSHWSHSFGQWIDLYRD